MSADKAGEEKIVRPQTSESKKRKIQCLALAGGGSGGHTYPLLALAAAFKQQNPQGRVFFISTPRSVEERILRNAGYEFFLITSGKLNSQGLLRKLQTLLLLPLAFFQSARILWAKRPDIVVSAGGYAGAPFLVSAALLGFSTAIYEQNRTPGLANRLMSKLAGLILLNFAGTQEFFPGRRTRAVGLPFRKEILQSRWNEAEWRERRSKRPFQIFVFGGSQGAVSVNRLVLAALEFLRDREQEIFIHHQTGQVDIEIVERQYRELGFTNCRVEAYVYDMNRAYREAHLVICRAGASTLAELAAAGKASILIPLESRDNHQEPNARELSERGAAILFRQSEGTAESLAKLIRSLMDSPERLSSLSEKIQSSCTLSSENDILAALEESKV